MCPWLHKIPLLHKLKQLYKHLPVRFSIDTTYIAIDVLCMLYVPQDGGSRLAYKIKITWSKGLLGWSVLELQFSFPLEYFLICQVRYVILQLVYIVIYLWQWYFLEFSEKGQFCLEVWRGNTQHCDGISCVPLNLPFLRNFIFSRSLIGAVFASGTIPFTGRNAHTRSLQEIDFLCKQE